MSKRYDLIVCTRPIWLNTKMFYLPYEKCKIKSLKNHVLPLILMRITRYENSQY